jgi:hypothetical protein
VDLRTRRTTRSAIEIRAPLEVVWRVLTDFAAYQQWNPHIRRIRGNPRVGGRIMVHSQPPARRVVVMRPLVLVWSPPNELRWRATFLSRHLFSVEYGFRLEAVGDKRVRFTQDGTFTGLLVPLYARLRLPATREGFAQVNEALRRRAEAAKA